ncbi:uridine phosphorylase [Candidatus Peregrinibacteria bacterium]|jgi:uridine phosphorylase|nr:uridine phosphorylase [Candidatus Peregrinibacteria bacterium]MBT4148022.1 uridine phosphorylase [Candidatus Peregrinibacteria bacterium]MBT4366610.1 uridine phosphorylase [Candidatus Peregrinibacteria bacterium]MBT4455597.1 uridine phosphorylase [Candidatus Peregrinibacteria bacterium]
MAVDYLGEDDVIELQNPHLEEMDSDFLYHLGFGSLDELVAKFKDVKYVCMGGSADRAEVFAGKAEICAEEWADKLGVDGFPEEFHLRIPQSVRDFVQENVELDSSSQLDLLSQADRDFVQKVEGLDLLSQSDRDFVKEKGLLELPEDGAIPIGKTERFSMFKIGPIISINHGMGVGSIEICLNEIAKLLSYAGATGVKFLRLGTSGGIGVPPGTAVITDMAYNDELSPFQRKVACGKVDRRETGLSKELAEAILECRGDVNAVIGSTVAANGFYENQGRLDGAICDYTEQDKMAFLKEAHHLGVRNMEMEATEFAAFTRRLRIRAAIICSTLLNRLEGDQVTSTPEELGQFADNSQQIALNFIKKELGLE